MQCEMLNLILNQEKNNSSRGHNLDKLIKFDYGVKIR